MRALTLLSEREKNKLSRLADEKRQSQQKLERLATRRQALERAAENNAQQRYQHTSPVLLQNNVNMALALEAVSKQLTRQQMLHDQEKQRIEKLWRRQLGRHLGLEVALENARQEKLKRMNKLEQKSADEFAGRLSRG